MFKVFSQDFKKLPTSNKSMVYLMWIYLAGTIVGGFFVNIYVFQMNKQILDVLFYNIFFVSTTFLGFSGIGFLMSKIRKDIKVMYYISYILFIIAFLFLFLFTEVTKSIFIFALLYGLGNGAFRCAVHTQELVHIKDVKRDIYSSAISAGQNIISFAVPLIIAILFFISSHYFKFNVYATLFLSLPGLYIISFFFIRNIESYIPSKIAENDISNFFDFKKYKFGLTYLFGVSLYQGLGLFLIPIIAIVILKTEMNVGMYEGILSIISTLFVVMLSKKRNIDNRIKIMGYLTGLLFINYMIFFMNFSLIGYIAFTLLGIILNPLYRVSEHVYDLKIMDTIKNEGSDFYPAMILREYILWIGRIFVIMLMIVMIMTKAFNLEFILRIGLLLVPLFFFITWGSIYLHLKYEDKIEETEHAIAD